MKEYIDAANAILKLVAAKNSFYQTNIAGRNYRLIEFIESKNLPGSILLVLDAIVDPDEGPLPFGDRIEILIGKYNWSKILVNLASDALIKDKSTYISL